MTQPDSEADQQRAMDRMVMDYPVRLIELPDLLSPQTPAPEAEPPAPTREQA